MAHPERFVRGRFDLQRALRAAWRAAGALGPDPSGGGVALYADGATPLQAVARWVKRLCEAGAPHVELLLGSDLSVAHALHARWRPAEPLPAAPCPMGRPAA